MSEFEEAVGVHLSEDAAKIEEARKKLDAGLGAELFAKCRAAERTTWTLFNFFDPRYTTLILGAYMMHMGAKIDPDDRRHLNEIFPKIPSKNGYVLPLFDHGFRDPGQVQYKAALENYVDGTPRSFFDPR